MNLTCAEKASIEIASIVEEEELEYILRPIPSVNLEPSNRQPFVFLHIEKTAGTTFRRHLALASQRNRLPFFIVSHGGIPHETFD